LEGVKEGRESCGGGNWQRREGCHRNDLSGRCYCCSRNGSRSRMLIMIPQEAAAASCCCRITRSNRSYRWQTTPLH
jgi:hypothetical protein